MNYLKLIIPDKIKLIILSIRSRITKQSNPQGFITYCVCCGSQSILYSPILWDELIQQWDLSEEEAGYINRQQGVRCKRCKTRLRGMAIAHGMMRDENYTGLFKDFVKKRNLSGKAVLEINQADYLTQYLQWISRHTLARYPDIDICDLPYADAAFDIVLHSDTLEHVPDPIAALQECWRVLKPGGYCIFTVPLVIGRLSRSRTGLPLSRHGSPEQKGDDYIVYTEFGADLWKYPIEAGFSEVRVYSLEYPAAQSILCRK